MSDPASENARLLVGRRLIATVAILSGLTAMGPLSMDMYLPAFPQVAADLGASADVVQVSLAVNVAGIVVGQLVLSSLSDALGRRRIVLVSMIVTGVLAFGQAAAASIEILIVLRFLAGVCAGAGIAIARAIAADIASGNRAARLFSLFIALAMAGPIAAPIIGGVIFAATGTWRSTFVAQGLLVVVLTVAIGVAIPETLPRSRRHSGGLGRLGRGFVDLAADRPFVGYALTLAFSYSALFAYLAVGPFALQEEFGLSPLQFSAVFAINAVGVIAVGLANSRLVRRTTPRRLLGVGIVVAVIGAAGLALSVVARVDHVAAVLVCLFVVLASRGLMTANATFLGVERSGLKGTASAILGAAMFAGGIVVSPILAALPMDAAAAMATVVAAGSVASALAFLLTASGQHPRG